MKYNMVLLNITALAILFVSAMSMPAAKNRIAKHVLDPLSYSLHNQKLSKSSIKQEGPPLSLLRKSMLQPIASARGLGLRPSCSKKIWEATSDVGRCQNISDFRIVFDTVINYSTDIETNKKRSKSWPHQTAEWRCTQLNNNESATTWRESELIAERPGHLATQKQAHFFDSGYMNISQDRQGRRRMTDEHQVQTAAQRLVPKINTMSCLNDSQKIIKLNTHVPTRNLDSDVCPSSSIDGFLPNNSSSSSSSSLAFKFKSLGLRKLMSPSSGALLDNKMNGLINHIFVDDHTFIREGHSNTTYLMTRSSHSKEAMCSSATHADCLIEASMIDVSIVFVQKMLCSYNN